MQPRRTAALLRIGISLVIVAGFAVAAWRMGIFDPGEAEELQRTAGREYLLPAFIALYAGITALALPGSPLALGAGAIFGFTRGAIVVWVASLIGAAAGYVLARGVLSKPARRLIGRHGELEDLKEPKRVLLTSLRLQLLPFIPFGVINYAAGIARIPVLPFLLATALGIIPGTLVETFVGDRLHSGVRGDRTALILGITIPLAVFGLSLLPKLIQKLRG